MEPTTKDGPMKRAEIRAALKTRRGAISRLARDLGISHVAVIGVLRGRSTSARVLEAAEREARAIVAEREAAQ